MPAALDEFKQAYNSRDQMSMLFIIGEWCYRTYQETYELKRKITDLEYQIRNLE